MIERLLTDAVEYYRVGLMGFIYVSLTIGKRGSSLPYIEAGAVSIIALPVWMSIRKVKVALSTVTQRDR